MNMTAATRREDTVLITGGAGFIGTNLATRLVDAGRRVVVYDNLSRAGVEQNLRWLRARCGERLQFELGDTRDADALSRAVAAAATIFHFAAQAAVTTSVDAPRADFEVNAGGTINLLEAIRAQPQPPTLVFASTSKVYGDLGAVELRASATRYHACDARLRMYGLDESTPLDFRSPHGCSKGAADQYVLDYARSYDIPAVVLRLSCVYGPHQLGNEDQGWVAHFLLRALQHATLTLHGDGRQVRDVLHVDDLVDALCLCSDHIARLAGRAFNIGGGPARTVSLVELLELIAEDTGHLPRLASGDRRAGDARWYVSDTRAFSACTGWYPHVAVGEGIRRLHDWLAAYRSTPLAGAHAA